MDLFSATQYLLFQAIVTALVKTLGGYMERETRCQALEPPRAAAWELQLDRIHDALLGSEESSDSPETADDPQAGLIQTVTAPQAAVIQALKGGEKDRNAVLKSASQNLGRARLGPNLRLILENTVENLVARKVVLSEESELFLGEQARNASFSSDNMPYEARRSYGRRRRYSRFRPRRW